MGSSFFELNLSDWEMASLGFISFVKDHEGSRVSASVATPLVVHPGVRLSNTNKGFVYIVRASKNDFLCVWVARISILITEIERWPPGVF